MHHAHSPAFFYIRGQGDWVSPETLGAGHMPGGYATPNSHGLGISSATEHPDVAWEFVKLITDEPAQLEIYKQLGQLQESGGVKEYFAGLGVEMKDKKMKKKPKYIKYAERREKERILGPKPIMADEPQVQA